MDKAIGKAEKKAEGRSKKSNKATKTYEKYGQYTNKHIRVKEEKIKEQNKK